MAALTKYVLKFGTCSAERRLCPTTLAPLRGGMDGADADIICDLANAQPERAT
jgi:hypothetical protein